MAEAGTLTLAFVSSHPVDAAKVLERLSVADAAALFTNLPARAAAPVLEAMLSPAAARILVALDDQAALGLLSATGVQSAVAMLRHVREPRRTTLIEGLSTTTALASRMLLGYPDDTVGAWADPEAIVVGSDTATGEALARVRGNPGLEANEIYVVDESQRLQGIVGLQVLLRAHETMSLAALMRPPAGVLPVAMPLSGAAAHPAWKQTNIMPVVERGDRFIGVLHAAKLAETLSRGHSGHTDTPDETLSGMLARGYWDTVSGLLRVGLAVLPPAQPVLPVGK